MTSWSAYGAAWWDLEEFRQKDVAYMQLGDLPSLVPDHETNRNAYCQYDHGRSSRASVEIPADPPEGE